MMVMGAVMGSTKTKLFFKAMSAGKGMRSIKLPKKPFMAKPLTTESRPTKANKWKNLRPANSGLYLRMSHQEPATKISP